MKKVIFNMIVSVFVVILLSKSSRAGELLYGDIAKCVRASALGYKEKFKNLIKGGFASGDQQTVYSVTNGDTNVSVVYFGCAQRLLSVDVKRSWATNETFRFSRQSGEITRYEAYDADCSGYELSYHTNGTLRSFVRIANARYQGKKYHFDLDGRVRESVDVDNRPVFLIRAPRDAGMTISEQDIDEARKVLNQL